jgi:hypothetical protein
MVIREHPNGVRVISLPCKLTELNGRSPEKTLRRGCDVAREVFGDTPWWLGEGTALGFAREGDFIGYDTDIDIHSCFHWDDFENIAFTTLRHEMESAGFSPCREMSYEGRITQLAYIDRNNNGVIFDYYFFWVSQSNLDVCSQYNEEGVQNMPFVFVRRVEPTITKYGFFPMIQPASAYLEYRYGQDWMTPIKSRHNPVREPLV